jgi:hypothetical protein
MEAAMNTATPSRLKLDISFVRGVWQVVIFRGDQTEHRSFCTEAEARTYGSTRIEKLQLKLKSHADDAAI